MIVEFRTRRLERYYRVAGEAARRMPPQVAEAYVDAIDTLVAAKTIDDLRPFASWRLESLGGPWRGHHSLWLNRDWRVILRVADEPDRVTIIDLNRHDYRRR